MESFLILGFFVGMAHALEADHFAAVGALATNGIATPKRLGFLGASWGMGRSTTLLLLSIPAILFGTLLSERLAAGPEFAAGAMLVVLGAQVLWKLHRRRVHLHSHDHGNGKKHFHAHSHIDASRPLDQDDRHRKHPRYSLRAYMVGLALGAAGSAGLIALAAVTTQNVFTAISCVFLFGTGSIIGMGVLTYSASWPLRLVDKSATNALKLMQVIVAVIAVVVGTRVMAETDLQVKGAV